VRGGGGAFKKKRRGRDFLEGGRGGKRGEKGGGGGGGGGGFHKEKTWLWFRWRGCSLFNFFGTLFLGDLFWGKDKVGAKSAAKI